MFKTLVPGEGPKTTCKICIIGEAPGAEEVKLRRPFVGKSGELLAKSLIRAGIHRGECYVTNVVKEQPPKNDITVFLPTVNRASSKPTAEYFAYEADLMSELSDCSANVYLCLGNTAMYALTRKLSIMKRRGSIMEGSINGRIVKVIPSIHPAACLRDPLLTYLLWNDIERLAEEQGFPEIKLPERNLLIRPNYSQTIDYLNNTLTQRIIAADIETSNKSITCISIAHTPFDAISIPFIEGSKDYWTPDQEVEIWKLLAKILEANHITKVFQNAIYDCSFILDRYGIKVWPVEDTMIAQAIIAPDFPKGLDFLCSIYTKEPYYKDEGKEWRNWKEGQDTFWRYNAKDSAVTMEILPHLKNILVQQQNLDTYQRTIALLRPLMYMQQRGLCVDAEGLKLESKKADEELVKLQDQLNVLAGRELNFNSNKQLKDYFYKERGFREYHNRKTGAVACDEKALLRLSEKSAEAKIILAMRELGKLKSTYFDATLDPDGRLRCSFNPVGTTSGRLASRKSIFGTGANFQNLPERFKRYVRADTGYVLYGIDLAQAENRVVSYIAPEPNMINAFERGIDLHKQTAALIFGIDINQVTPDQRQQGKMANHGLNYDLGYKSFAELYDIPTDTAKFIVDKYHQVYPGIRHYHQWVRDELQKTRSLRTPLGRYRKFYDRWGDPLFKEAYSFIPQSTVAEKINRDGVLFIYQNQEIFYAVEQLNTVHDSLLFQIPLKMPWTYHAECLRLIVDSLQSPIAYKQFNFRIPADLSMGLLDYKNSKKPVPGMMRGVKTAQLDPLTLHTVLADIYSQLHEETTNVQSATA